VDRIEPRCEKPSPAPVPLSRMPPLRAPGSPDPRTQATPYGESILFLGAGLEVGAGRSHRFSWDHGAGKSTLPAPDHGAGAARRGHLPTGGAHTVVAGYFEQNQAGALDLAKR